MTAAPTGTVALVTGATLDVDGGFDA